MTSDAAPSRTIRAAQIVLPCEEIEPTLTFFVERLGFRVESISPADDPGVVVISGHGTRIELRRDGSGAPGTLRLLCHELPSDGDVELLAAPNGTRIELAPCEPPVTVPAASTRVAIGQLRATCRSPSGSADGNPWKTGRAGMRYRDLIPGRLGGHLIASHIKLPEGGPVPDYVHFHKIRFQLIYCAKGWVRVVYEDQGPPFVMEEGDCVLQPPRIRHRVLESSPGLEVIEVSCPAEHETIADHQLSLPTTAERRTRLFEGQRFVRSRGSEATWQPRTIDGLRARDLGVEGATDGRASAEIVRAQIAGSGELCTTRLLFLYILQGGVCLEYHGSGVAQLGTGDSAAIPAETRCSLAYEHGAELLEVGLPG